jgi:hypothetical protein
LIGVASTSLHPSSFLFSTFSILLNWFQVFFTAFQTSDISISFIGQL